MTHGDATISAHRPMRIAVVDDDPFVLKMWVLANPDVVVYTFTSPAEFWQALADECRLLEELHCVVTDHHFDCDEGESDGEQFAEELRRVFSQPIILNSNLMFAPGELSQVFDAQVTTKTSSWREIEPLVPTASRRRTPVL